MAAMAMCKKTQQKAQQKHELWPCSAWDTEDEPMEKRVCFFCFFGKVPEVRDDGSMNCGICFFFVAVFNGTDTPVSTKRKNCVLKPMIFIQYIYIHVCVYIYNYIFIQYK